MAPIVRTVEQSITTLPQGVNKKDAAFAAFIKELWLKTPDFANDLIAMADKLNLTVGDMNSLGAYLEGLSDDMALISIEVMAASNFGGVWKSDTNYVGKSVLHEGEYYISLADPSDPTNDNSNITPSDDGVNYKALGITIQSAIDDANASATKVYSSQKVEALAATILSTLNSADTTLQNNIDTVDNKYSNPVQKSAIQNEESITLSNTSKVISKVVALFKGQTVSYADGSDYSSFNAGTDTLPFGATFWNGSGSTINVTYYDDESETTTQVKAVATGTSFVNTGTDAPDLTVPTNISGYYIDRATNKLYQYVDGVSDTEVLENTVLEIPSVEAFFIGRTSATRFKFNSLRGALYEINTNNPDADVLLANSLLSFENGIVVGTADGVNTASSDYVLEVTRYTHIAYRKTNVGKPYVVMLNQYGGRAKIIGLGSGAVGHTWDLEGLITGDITLASIKALDVSSNYHVFSPHLTDEYFCVLNSGGALITDANRLNIKNKSLTTNSTWLGLGTNNARVEIDVEFNTDYHKVGTFVPDKLGYSVLDLFLIYAISIGKKYIYSVDLDENQKVVSVLLKNISTAEDWRYIDYKRGANSYIRINSTVTAEDVTNSIASDNLSISPQYIDVINAGGSETNITLTNAVAYYTLGKDVDGYTLQKNTIISKIVANALFSGLNEDAIVYLDELENANYTTKEPSFNGHKKDAFEDDGLLVCLDNGTFEKNDYSLGSSATTHDIFGDSSIKMSLPLNGNSSDLGATYTPTDTDIAYLQNGRFGYSAGFNGSTSKIATGYSFVAGEPFNISSHIKNSSNTNKYFLHGAETYTPILSISDTDTSKFAMWLSSNGTSWDIASGTKICDRIDNKYFNLQFDYDGTYLKVFIDLVEVFSVAWSGMAFTLNFGGTGANSFAGTASNIRVANRSLTATERLKLYLESVTAMSSSIVKPSFLGKYSFLDGKPNKKQDWTLFKNVMDATVFKALVSMDKNVKRVSLKTIYNNMERIIDNPFGNENWAGCDVLVYLVINGKVEFPSWDGDTGTGINAYGTKAHSTPEGIEIVTGSYAVIGIGKYTGSTLDGEVNYTSADAYVLVKYHGKVEEV